MNVLSERVKCVVAKGLYDRISVALADLSANDSKPEHNPENALALRLAWECDPESQVHTIAGGRAYYVVALGESVEFEGKRHDLRKLFRAVQDLTAIDIECVFTETNTRRWGNQR